MKKLFKIVSIIALCFIVKYNSYAANYYISPDGNDLNTGLSDAQAWKNIEKVNKFPFKSGDDIFFKCNSEFITNAMLFIDWSGTKENRVIVGAYYMENGKEIIGIKGERPIINGALKYPKNNWNGLIYAAANKDYITVEDLEIKNSNGYGILFHTSDYGKVDNCKIQTTYRSGIHYNRSSYGLVQKCIVSDTGRSFLDGKDWPFAVGGMPYSKYLIIRNCIVKENYGEGIGLYSHSDYGLVEKNILWSNRSAAIYIATSSHCTIKYNIIYGTINKKFWTWKNVPGGGIAIADEYDQATQPFAKGNKIFNNLIAYSKEGIGIYQGAEGAIVDEEEIYNNTIIDCIVAIHINNSNKKFRNSFIINNIFYAISPDAKLYSGRNSTPGMIWSHNNWSSNPPYSFLKSEYDIIGNPELHRKTGWRKLGGIIDEINAKDFSPEAYSIVIGKGKKLDDTFKYSIKPTASWPNNVYLIDQNSLKSGWIIGAVRFIPSSPKLYKRK